MARADGLLRNRKAHFARGALGAAAGIVAGIALTQGKRAVMQAASTALATDWAAALQAEHHHIRALLDKLVNSARPAARMRRLNALERAIAKHAFEEESVIYPALRAEGRPNDAHDLEHDHADVKAELFALRALAASPAWEERAGRLREKLAEHMRQEEQLIFPAFHAQLSQAKNATLTKALHAEGLKLA